MFYCNYIYNDLTQKRHDKADANYGHGDQNKDKKSNFTYKWDSTLFLDFIRAKLRTFVHLLQHPKTTNIHGNNVKNKEQQLVRITKKKLI